MNPATAGYASKSVRPTKTSLAENGDVAQVTASLNRNQMRQLADKLEAAIAHEDPQTYLMINRAIHAQEPEAAHNRYLLRQTETIHALSRRF